MSVMMLTFFLFLLHNLHCLLVIPLLCVALSAIIIYFTQSSIADAFSYPDVCWIKPTLYYCLIFPLLLIVVVIYINNICLCFLNAMPLGMLQTTVDMHVPFSIDSLNLPSDVPLKVWQNNGTVEYGKGGQVFLLFLLMI